MASERTRRKKTLLTFYGLYFIMLGVVILTHRTPLGFFSWYVLGVVAGANAGRSFWYSIDDAKEEN